MARARKMPLALGVPFCLMLGLRLASPQPEVYSGGGVVLSRVDLDLGVGADTIQARVGDWLLETDAVRVTVGASRVDAERSAQFGAVLDVTPSDWSSDAIAGLHMVLELDGERLDWKTVALEPVRVGGTIVLQRTETALEGRIVATTELRVAPSRPALELSTRLENRGATALGPVRLGDSVDWSGQPTFAPGLGSVRTSTSARLPWFGRESPDAGYVFTSPDGPLRVWFDIGPRDARQVAWSDAAVLEPGEARLHRRLLVAAYGGLAEAVAFALEATQTPFGVIDLEIDPPSPGARVTATHADGSIALRTTTVSGHRVRLPLTRGRYSLTLRTTGGTSSTWVDVRALHTERVRLDAPRGGDFAFRVTDSADRSLAARLVLRGLAGTPDPDLGPDHRAVGRNEIHSASGSGRIELPPGRYEVTVTHGPEYSRVRRIVDIDEHAGAVLPVILIQEVETPGWLSADFHVHAAPSMDSEVSLVDRVTSLMAAGVELAVATDHNHATDYGPAVRALAARSALAHMRGIEVTTEHWGHFNVFPLRAGTENPPYAQIVAEDLFAWIRKSHPSSIIQVNHPWMPGYGYFHRAGLDDAGHFWKPGASFDFNAIEVVNGFELGDTGALERNLSRWFALLNLGRRYTAVGNSDSHRVSREWVGYPRTYVAVPDDRPAAVSPERVVDALRTGRAIVSGGPFIELHANGYGVGDTVAVDDILDVEVVVQAAEWIDVQRVDLVMNGEIVDVLPLGLPEGAIRLRRHLELPVTEDGWLIALVTGDRPLDDVLPGTGARPFAFTNPIWIRVGRDADAQAPQPRPARKRPRPSKPATEAHSADARPPSLDGHTPETPPEPREAGSVSPGLR
jgi:hypothetical protein